jgi:hypothetical protein
MDIPGFRAEASLYRDSDLYTSTHTSTASNDQVVPQLPISCYIQAFHDYYGCVTRDGIGCYSQFRGDIYSCNFL